jgi:hypothetical protein
VFTLIPTWVRHTYDFVVLTSLTHPRKILLLKDLSAPLRSNERGGERENIDITSTNHLKTLAYPTVEMKCLFNISKATDNAFHNCSVIWKTIRLSTCSCKQVNQTMAQYIFFRCAWIVASHVYWFNRNVRTNIWARVPRTKTRKNVHINMCPETFNSWVIAERTASRYQQNFSINMWAGIVSDCLVGLHVLPRRSTGNNYRDFLLQDLPKLLEAVQLVVKARMWRMRDDAPAHSSCAVVM